MEMYSNFSSKNSIFLSAIHISEERSFLRSFESWYKFDSCVCNFLFGLQVHVVQTQMKFFDTKF